MNGELDPVTYIPGRVPLSEATIWPDDLTAWEADRYAARLEDQGNRLIGAAPCPAGEHWMMGDPEPVPIEARFRCPKCRAEP